MGAFDSTSTTGLIDSNDEILCDYLKQNNIKEVLGQVFRIIGAALFTAVKGVPIGNTGGSNVSPIKVMPIKPEHAAIISKAKDNA